MKIGIDFGTFYSSAAVMIGDTLKLVKDPVRHGYAFPSSVFITEQGEVLVGQAAENQRLKDLSRYRREFKRELGQDIPVILGDRSFRVEEIIAEVLKKLKEEAMLLDGDEVRDAVITVPAMYAQYKKKLMETAGKAAGFEVTLLEEPVAAATYYNWQSNGNHCSSDEEIILVFDLGGGTFDVALVQKKGAHYELLTMPAGLEHCGGLDFDRKIYEDLKNRCSPQLRNILDTRDDKAMRSRFMIAEWCQDIKHQLSEAKEAEILIPIGDMENYSLTREAFNVMIEPMVMEAIHLCESLVKKSGLGWGKVGRILLVGGSCRIPHIQNLLTTHTGRPLSLVDDPEFAVCQGAALHGLKFQKQTVKASEKTSSPGTNKNKPISKPEPVEKAIEPVSASETGDVVSATDLSSQSSLERPGETIILDYKILSEVIIRLLGRYNINSVPLFISPAIPPGKLINSRQSCKIPKSEEILGLIDCTFFGSAKNALVFGEKGIYFHSTVVETIPHKDTPETKINEVADSLKYDRFPESTFEAVGVYLHLDGRPKFNWEKVGGDWVVAILDDIKKVVLRLERKEGGLADDGRVGAAKKSEPIFRSIVLDILKESKAQSLYSSPGIPPKKITNATKSCMVPENEKIIGIIDCTFWGSATDAMVFGENGIYFHSDVIEIQGQEEIRVSVPMTGKLDYNDFPSEKFLIKDDHIEFNNKLRFYKCYIDIEPLVQTLKKIKRQIKIIYKGKQQSVTGTLQQVVKSKKGG